MRVWWMCIQPNEPKRHCKVDGTPQLSWRSLGIHHRMTMNSLSICLRRNGNTPPNSWVNFFGSTSFQVRHVGGAVEVFPMGITMVDDITPITLAIYPLITGTVLPSSASRISHDWWRCFIRNRVGEKGLRGAKSWVSLQSIWIRPAEGLGFTNNKWGFTFSAISNGDCHSGNGGWDSTSLVMRCTNMRQTGEGLIHF